MNLEHPLYPFLHAKFALDRRSLNSDVWNTFNNSINDFNPLQLLDVGTGTGSMIRHLLETSPAGTWSLTGLDQEAELLQTANIEIATILSNKGFKLTNEGQQISAFRQQDVIEFIPINSSLSNFDCASESFHVITAHAFMDLVPLNQVVTQFFAWLIPRGLFYSTINYDCETVIFPPYADNDFEQQILFEYDMSMERRQISGQTAGGAKCGRRLFQALQQSGFTILAYGSSDWNIVPIKGDYRDDDQVVLAYLLQWMFAEAEKNSSIDKSKLKQWYQYRLDQLTTQALGIIIHQLDILAQKV